MISIDGKVVDFKKFPNNETLFEHKQLEAEHGWIPRRITFKYEDDSDFVKLTILKEYLDSIEVKSPDLLITYMPYSRMDRSEEGSAFTLKTIAGLINRLNFHRVVIVEPHSDVTCALIDRATPYYVNYNLIHAVKQAVEFDEKFDYVVFPDAGAQKRYSKMPAQNTLVGFKHRDFKTGHIESLDLVGKMHGYIKHNQPSKAIIVDDMSSFGGTFVHTAKALRAKGIDRVYLLVAHAENSIFRGKFKDDPGSPIEQEKTLFAYVDGVFTTDSLLTEHKQNWHTAIYDKQLTVYELRSLL